MSDLKDVRLPSDQLEGTTNEVGQWLKRIGDPVRKDEPLLEVITDKVTVEIAAPVEGVLAEILKQSGASLQRGDVLGRIRTGASAPAKSSPPPPAAASAGASAIAQPAELSPAVRRLVQEHGLDPTAIKGTGQGGRITVQDVEAHLARSPDRPAPIPGSRIPHSPMRRSIAEHMTRSVHTAPHVTAVFEADLTRVAEHRTAHPGITYTAYFVRASVSALQAVPQANSRWHDDGLELFEDCNIGMAVALEGGGLIVPVLHQAQSLDLAEIARRLGDITGRAREGRLTPAEVQGGTFSISNHGVSGSVLAAPIVIVQPQSAILGVGKVERRPRVMASGVIEARPMAYVSLTIDHRVLDGFQANSFLSKWVEVIEQWT